MRLPSLQLIGLNGAHSLAYIYIVFKALNLNGTDIMGLTFKLLNPEDVIRVLKRERRKRVSRMETGKGGRQRGNDGEEAEERNQ